MVECLIEEPTVRRDGLEVQVHDVHRTIPTSPSLFQSGFQCVQDRREPSRIPRHDLSELSFVRADDPDRSRIVDQFDEMVRQCEAQPLVCVVSLHTYIVGQPFRLRRYTFFDIGKRDDAAFWFYAAMDRYFTLIEVAQPGASILAISTEAMRGFVALVGPYVNGYAFCDLAKQRDIRAKALAWVEAHPYEAIFSDKIPARSQDRKAALAAAIASAKEAFDKERAYLDNKDNVAKLKEDRQKNEMDAKFCWK